MVWSLIMGYFSYFGLCRDFPFHSLYEAQSSVLMNGSFADMDVPISLLVMLPIHIFLVSHELFQIDFLTCWYRNDDKSLPLAYFMLFYPHFGWRAGILWLLSYQRDPQMYLHLWNSSHSGGGLREECNKKIWHFFAKKSLLFNRHIWKFFEG